jgi:chromate transporter
MHVYTHTAGPLYNFSAFCGALALRQWGTSAALTGAAIAWLAIYTPGLLAITGVLPLWHKYRGFPTMKVGAAIAVTVTVVVLLPSLQLSCCTA